jgi:hypothetical protein
VNTVDSKVIADVWIEFDKLSQTVKHAEKRDTVIPLYKIETTSASDIVTEGLRDRVEKMKRGW